VLPLGIAVVLLPLVTTAIDVDGSRQQQQEDAMGKITIMPLLFRLGFLRGKITYLPPQLISNYF
jgi:hypothetical protein